MTQRDQCPFWSGPGIAASVCDEKTLSQALAEGTLNDVGSVSLSIQGRNNRFAASAPGIAQIADRPLGPGDKVLIHGPLAVGSVLNVQVASDRQLQRETFTLNRRIQPGASIAIDRRGGARLHLPHSSDVILPQSGGEVMQ